MSIEGGTPRELVVDAKPAPGDSSDGAGSAMAPIAVPVLAAGLLAKFVSSTAGAVALGAALVMLLLRRKAKEGRFVLRMNEDGVEVTREHGEAMGERIALLDLLDVSLDKKTNQANGRAAERVRIAFERRGPDGAPLEPIFVPDTRLTPLEGQEWQGKVRVFLRKHGWVPEDER